MFPSQLPQQIQALGLHHTSGNVPVAPQGLHRFIVVAGPGGLVEQGAPGVLVLQEPKGRHVENCGDMMRDVLSTRGTRNIAERFKWKAMN